MSRIPGRDEPDPKNERFRPFQGGADSLPETTGTVPEKYLELPHGAGAGPSGITHPPAVRAGGARVRTTEPQ